MLCKAILIFNVVFFFSAFQLRTMHLDENSVKQLSKGIDRIIRSAKKTEIDMLNNGLLFCYAQFFLELEKSSFQELYENPAYANVKKICDAGVDILLNDIEVRSKLAMLQMYYVQIDPSEWRANCFIKKYLIAYFKEAIDVLKTSLKNDKIDFDMEGELDSFLKKHEEFNYEKNGYILKSTYFLLYYAKQLERDLRINILK